MKVLLGGIPLGCRNIGDEAILACAVKILRRNFPGCEITVCTAERESTARLLSVNTASLFGFAPDAPLSEFRKLAARHDFYFWAGATGLSDYPHAALRLLRAVRQAGIPAIVWGVGMDSTLNPAFFRLQGRKRRLLDLASRLTARKVDFAALLENRMVRSMRRRLAGALRQCRLVAVRDPQTRQELLGCGFADAVVGADSAILLETGEQTDVRREPGLRKIGVCISAQRKIHSLEKLTALFDRLLEDPSNRLVFIPMNPVTDRVLMEELRRKLRRPERSFLLENCPEPERVQSAAANCDVIVSSRLHLLILAANVNTPVIGISRGSKVDNFLDNFGFTAAGTVENCDFDGLQRRIAELSADPAYREKSAAVHVRLLERLNRAEQFLRHAVEETEKGNGKCE